MPQNQLATLLPLIRGSIQATIILLLLPIPCFSATWLVGPKQDLKLPSQAAKVAKEGDSVLIEAGIYPEDVSIWSQNRLTLRGINGRPHLEAQGQSAESKAIWVIKGNDIRVENIEFSGAAVPDRNGAGIRFEGSNLTLSNCHFHHNQMGILTGANPISDILIEGSEFNDNTVDYERFHSLGHNIYIGGVRRFTLRNSYVHDAQTGHNVKSRAKENYILYNRIDDERNASSYLLDLSEGGQAFLIGNQFRQSPYSDNSAMVSFAAEGNRNNPQQSFYLVNNTFVNDHSPGVFVNNHSKTPAILINNLLIGKASRIEGPYELQQNLMLENTQFRNRGEYDYHLTADSAAIDNGIDSGQTTMGFSLRPEYEYSYPLAIKKRKQQDAIDIGAYEFE